MKWWDRLWEPERPIELTADGLGIIAPAKKAEDISTWIDEWFEARKAAVDAIAEQPPFAIWQSVTDGWWYVGSWGVQTIPNTFPAQLAVFRKPSMKVTAYGLHSPFSPTFKTEDEAKEWLKAYLRPPEQKRTLYDAEGNEVSE